MPFRIARSHIRVLVSLLAAIPLSVGLYAYRSELARASDASLDFVGHLISGLHSPFLDPLDPTYPRCF